jgi:DNA mismatch repair protein MutS
MNDWNDLHLDREILPLFDYTLNPHAKSRVLEILHKPLASLEAIEDRQSILRGFIQNHTLLKGYSYTVYYVEEVLAFTTKEKIEEPGTKKLRYALLTPKHEKVRYKSRFHQLILFFHRLESVYFSRLNTGIFPPEYQNELRTLVGVLSRFRLAYFEPLVRENRIKGSHILELIALIGELRNSGEIQRFWEAFFRFEAFLSISKGIQKHKLVFPEFGKQGIELKEFYHPLLDQPVKNALVTSQNVLVINGANMSGKSTLLKAIGLCVYLGHTGLAVPASAARLQFFSHFTIDINRRDDIENGYSHFMCEVMSLKAVLEEASAGNACLAIFDELFSGTNVEDGFQICKTTLEGLGQFENSLFIISTHIQELKTVCAPHISPYHIDCQLQDDQPTFTYLLKEGWSDVKVGQLLFEKEGLNELLA